MSRRGTAANAVDARRASSPIAPAPDAIVQPGVNCWRLDRAHRFYCVQDAADYFLLVRQALLAARHSIFILGWDITGNLDLAPGETPGDGAPTQLDRLIAYVATRRRTLRCHILTWDYGLLFTLERDPFSRVRLGWSTPRNVTFGFDDRHPLGASHHQKIVVVDDALAFCGGIDLTGHRWDTSAHAVEEPRRVTPAGKVYGPYHEVQAMVDGPAAASLGTLARERWRLLGARKLPAVSAPDADLWPAGVVPDLTDVDVAVARTMPGSERQPAVRECEALFFDAIARARRSIYIENQYFTHEDLGRAIAARLAEPDGPEVLIVIPKECDGWLERNSIALFRDEACRQMIAADRYERLRVVCPMAAPDVPTFVHSKVMIVDDTFVRIGSANCSRRSMGMDTECDLAVEARDDRDRAGIRQIRDRLLAEHLAMPVEAVGPAIAGAGSIVALVDARADQGHTLVRLEIPEAPPTPSPIVKSVVDPDEPLSVGAVVEDLVPAIDATGEGEPLRIWVLPAAVVIAAGMVAWQSWSIFPSGLYAVREAMGAMAIEPAMLAIGLAIFTAGAIATAPIELLTIAAGAAFGVIGGIAVAFTGSIAAAAVGYLLGRALAPSRIARWMSRRAYRSGRQLLRQGVGGIAVLRLASLANSASISMLAGSAHVPIGRYVAGTALGLAPIIIVLAGFGALVGRTLAAPTLVNGLLTAVAALFILAAAFGLRTLLLIRQFAPSLTRHRARAEFG